MSQLENRNINYKCHADGLNCRNESMVKNVYSVCVCFFVMVCVLRHYNSALGCVSWRPVLSGILVRCNRKVFQPLTSGTSARARAAARAR